MKTDAQLKKDVQAELEWDASIKPHHRVSDAEIAAVQMAFKWHALIPEDRIHFTVEKGWVTLTGAVDWEHQRHNAEAAVRPLTGVLGVVDKIRLREREAPDYVAHRIHEALARYAEDEATHIEVLVKGGTATLRGTVNSWAEHAIVQHAAWSAPGIQRVFDELKVPS